MVKMFRLQWWHIPNLLTILRLFGALALPVVAYFELPGVVPEGQLWVFFQGTTIWVGLWVLVCHQGFWTTDVFVVTASTDKLDGLFAKKIFGTTELGAALDPLVDKVLMLLSILTGAVVALLRGDWLVFVALLVLAIFLTFREVDVFSLKAAAARAENKVISARQSGRVSMVVFCVMMGIVLLPIIGFWSNSIKAVLILTTIVFSRRSWNDYKNTYGQFAEAKS